MELDVLCREWRRFIQVARFDWLATRSGRVLPWRWHCSCSSTMLAASSRLSCSTARIHSSPPTRTVRDSGWRCRGNPPPRKPASSVLSSISLHSVSLLPTRFVVTARSELHKVLFLALSITFLFVYEISPEPLNGFSPNSHGRRVWSLTQTSLKVKVNFGGLRAVYVWKDIFVVVL